MYDYRTHLKNLLDHTTNKSDSLTQTAIALNIISQILLDNKDTKKFEKQITMAVYRAINGLSYDNNSDIQYPVR